VVPSDCDSVLVGGIPRKYQLLGVVGFELYGHGEAFRGMFHTVEGVELHIHGWKQRQSTGRRHTAVVWVTDTRHFNAATMNVNISISLELHSRPMLNSINQFIRTRKNLVDSADGTSSGVSVMASFGMTGATPETGVHGP